MVNIKNTTILSEHPVFYIYILSTTYEGLQHGSFETVLVQLLGLVVKVNGRAPVDVGYSR